MKRLTLSDVIYAFYLSVACAVTYVLETRLLAGRVDHADTMLGGMWAVVATVFVFGSNEAGSVAAGILRLTATLASCILCFIYLALLPVNAIGIGVVIGLGTIVLMMLRQRDDIILTGITTAVVMVVAGLDPRHALEQPPLRLFDTIVGVAVGVLLKWAASYTTIRVRTASASSEPARPAAHR